MSRGIGEERATTIHCMSFTVRYYEIDCRGWIRPVTLVNYLQEVAAAHAMELGVAVADLRRLGLTWVLSRLHLQVERYVRSGETLLVRTWPSLREGFFTCREFEIIDATGRPLAQATSSWAALDLRTRRPVRLDDHLPAYRLDPRRAVVDEFSTLPQPRRSDRELTVPVRWADLDINRHVNNAVYVEWAMETVPLEVAEGYLLSGLEIGFRAEALYGEQITGRCEQVAAEPAHTFIHQIVNAADGRELARLRSSWQSVATTGQ